MLKLLFDSEKENVPLKRCEFSFVCSEILEYLVASVTNQKNIYKQYSVFILKKQKQMMHSFFVCSFSLMSLSFKTKTVITEMPVCF